MKIAIFIHRIGGTGGGQRAISKLAYYLHSKGHTVEFFTPFYDEKNIYDEFKQIKVNIIKPPLKFLSPFLFLFKKVKGFDIYLFDDFPAYFASINNKPNIMFCYTPKRDFYDLREFNYKNASFRRKIILFLKEILFKKLDFIAVKNVDTIITLSNHVQKRIEKYYKRKDSKVIRWGMDVDRFKKGKYSDYFLSVSRLVNAKRVDMIVKSMNFVKNKKIKLYVVGAGPEEENIKHLAKGNPNIQFFGEVSDAELINFYKDCYGVIYVPVSEDDQGYVNLEAGASEKPVITVNEGGTPEIITDGKAGFLINNVTPEKIAEKIDYLYKNKKLAVKMGKEGRRIAEKMDWGIVFPEFEKAIIESAKNKNKSLLE